MVVGVPVVPVCGETVPVVPGVPVGGAPAGDVVGIVVGVDGEAGVVCAFAFRVRPATSIAPNMVIFFIASEF